MILPVVSPMISVSGAKWYEAREQARSALDLGVEGEIPFPLLPRFDEHGAPFKQSLQASEIGEYLRQTLKVPSLSRNTLRSHSCKVTPLSWMAKSGASLQLRRNLGHHLDLASKSAECYSRDAMAPALRFRRDFSQTIRVLGGSFRPRTANEYQRKRKLRNMMKAGKMLVKTVARSGLATQALMPKQTFLLMLILNVSWNNTASKILKLCGV